MDNKINNAYKTIGEVARELGLINPKNGNLRTHTIRFWETQFKQIRPTIRAGNRRYYSNKDFKIIKKVKFMLKDQGLTIKGAKKILNDESLSSLDENLKLSVSEPINSNSIKKKITNISKIIKELKKINNG